MIEIKGLCKAFGEKVLFKDYNINIQNGDYVIFSGESGSGKTTLLNMIGAIEKVDSGTITVNNTDITKHKNQFKYFSDTVGFLFQNFALIEDKTVYENLKIIKKRSQSGISIDNALTKVGLSDKKNNKVYTLSGGEQQRIALARLMIKKCDIILADEPTGSLDEKNEDIVMTILEELNNDGKTVILVTHSPKIKLRGNRIIDI